LGDPSARGLLDDIAYLQPHKSGLAISTDTLVEGTHFLPNDPISSVARKLVRVNLSDIISKGCIPIGVFLNIAWPNNVTTQLQKEFASALGEELGSICVGVPLLGGDTTSTNGPMVASLVILGRPYGKEPIYRSGASVGDLVFVSGDIGNALIGLNALLGKADLSKFPQSVAHYRVPELPPIAIGKLIAKYANSSIDISDGLLGDAHKMAVCSNLGIEVELNDVPISSETIHWIGDNTRLPALLELFSFGDDYQALFTISPKNLTDLVAEAKREKVYITEIGKCVKGKGLSLCFEGNNIALPSKLSHEHQFQGTI